MAKKTGRRTWGKGRSEVVPVRFAEEEKRQVQRKAERAGVDLSAFIRQAALSATVSTPADVRSVLMVHLRLDLRRVHTSLQRAHLRAGQEGAGEHLAEAMALLDAVIKQLQTNSKETT